MHVYYYFLIPVKDRYIEQVDVKSLKYIRLNQKLFAAISKTVQDVDKTHFLLLKSVSMLLRI